MQVLDKLILNNGKEVRGVIDLSSAKHLLVIDLTNNSSPSLSQKLIEWKLFYPELRFVVYASMFNIRHPVPTLINKKDVKSSTLANPTQRIKKTERFTLPV